MDLEAEVAKLAALGYVETVVGDPDPERKGVVRHDPGRASPGINVYCSARSTRVRFLDMQGDVLHALALPEPGKGSDCMLEPYGDGSFLVLSWPHLMRIDADSRVRWISRKNHHHDVAVTASGEIVTLSELPGHVFLPGRGPLPIRDHSILILDGDGAVARQIGLSRFFRRYIPSGRLGMIRRLRLRPDPAAWPYELASDVYHPNTIEVLDRDVAAGRKGNLLVCLRELNLVAVLDPESASLVWSWGPGHLDRPHHPSFLANGNLLIFDNGPDRKWSRVIELDPAEKEIVWEYRGDPPESFYSLIGGSAQGLPNGNVLVTESTKGRVFEVTRSGEIVWEFWNPEATGEGLRKQVYRMLRLAVDASQLLPPPGAAAGPQPRPGDPEP